MTARSAPATHSTHTSRNPAMPDRSARGLQTDFGYEIERVTA